MSLPRQNGHYNMPELPDDEAFNAYLAPRRTEFPEPTESYQRRGEGLTSSPLATHVGVAAVEPVVTIGLPEQAPFDPTQIIVEGTYIPGARSETRLASTY